MNLARETLILSLQAAITPQENKNVYARINTMSAVGDDSIGSVVSIHSSVEAAKAADAKLQRMTKKANGKDSCLPTRIIRSSGKTTRYRYEVTAKTEPKEFRWVFTAKKEVEPFLRGLNLATTKFVNIEVKAINK